MPYTVTKTYPHSLGLSACFRQHKASHSHCRFLHGYPLSFTLTFGADKLDERNWVLDFGGLKAIKQWLVDHFDHKLAVAEDDPYRAELEALSHRAADPSSQLADVLVVPAVGCEAFAKMVFEHVDSWLHLEHAAGITERGLFLAGVECREHGGNAAAFMGDDIVRLGQTVGEE